MATPKNEELQAQSQLVRSIESNLKIKSPDALGLRFRGSLLLAATAQLDALNSQLVTRLYEAVCEVDFPKDEVCDFRNALQNKIAKVHSLRLYRSAKPATKSPTP